MTTASVRSMCVDRVNHQVNLTTASGIKTCAKQFTVETSNYSNAEWQQNSNNKSTPGIYIRHLVNKAPTPT
jgi:hypothetical protein